MSAIPSQPLLRCESGSARVTFGLGHRNGHRSAATSHCFGNPTNCRPGNIQEDRYLPPQAPRGKTREKDVSDNGSRGGRRGAARVFRPLPSARWPVPRTTCRRPLWGLQQPAPLTDSCFPAEHLQRSADACAQLVHHCQPALVPAVAAQWAVVAARSHLRGYRMACIHPKLRHSTRGSALRTQGAPPVRPRLTLSDKNFRHETMAMSAPLSCDDHVPNDGQVLLRSTATVHIIADRRVFVGALASSAARR